MPCSLTRTDIFKRTSFHLHYKGNFVKIVTIASYDMLLPVLQATPLHVTEVLIPL